MATAIQIQLMVDESGAVQGVRAFDAAVKGSAASVNTLDSTLLRMNERLDQLAVKAPRSMKTVGDSAISSREQVGLLSEEIGVHVPRGMQTVIAKSAEMKAELSTIGSTLIGIGAIQIGAMVFTQIADGVQKIWHNVLDVNAAVKDYNAEVEKTKAQDFGNSNSIETTTLRINEATAAVKAYQAEAAKHLAASQSVGLQAIGLIGLPEVVRQRAWAHDANANAMDWQRKLDELQNARRPEQQHKSNLDQIDLAHAGDARLFGEQKITAELDKQLAINRENARFENEQAGRYGNPVGSSSLWNTGKLSEAGTADFIAQQKAAAEAYNEERERAEELRKIHEETLESGLRGSALYHAQEASAIKDLEYRHLASASAVNDVRQKFHNEEMKRLAEEHRQTEEFQGVAALNSFKGIGHIQAQGDLDIAKINGDPNLSDEAKTQRVAAVKMRVNAEMLASQQEFTDQVDALADESATRQIGGFTRIAAAAQKAIDEKQKAFDQQYSQVNRGTPEGEAAYQQGLAQLNRAKGLITAGAGQESRDLQQRNADETAQIEMQAHARSMSAEKQQTLAIQAEYQARTQKYFEELQAGEILQDDYNRRMVAAEEEKNAQLVEASRAAREKMATEFDALFRGMNHPMQYLQEQGEKMAAQAAAALVQRMQNHANGGKGSGPLSGDFQLSNIWDRIAGNSKQPGMGGEKKGDSSANPLASISSAHISVGNATVVLSGYSGGGLTGSQGSYAAPTIGGITGASGASLAHADAGGQSHASAPSVGSPYAPAKPSTGEAAMNYIGQGLSVAGSATSMFGSGTDGKSSSGSTNGGDFWTDADANTAPNADGSGTGSTGTGSSSGSVSQSAAGSAAPSAGGLNAGLAGVLGGSTASNDASKGAQIGSVAGPAGMVVGAIVGAAIGIWQAREAARVYDLKTVRPRIAADFSSYTQGGDYLSAYSDLQSLDVDASRETDKMGVIGRSYFSGTIRPEIKQAEARLSAMEKAGRSQFTATAAQFADGTDLVHRTGLAVLHQHESVNTADRTERATRALERGADMETVARNYQQAMQAPAARATSIQTGWTGDMNFHAIDGKGLRQLFEDNKHLIRAAINSSYAENSGGADAGY